MALRRALSLDAAAGPPPTPVNSLFRPGPPRGRWTTGMSSGLPRRMRPPCRRPASQRRAAPPGAGTSPACDEGRAHEVALRSADPPDPPGLGQVHGHPGRDAASWDQPGNARPLEIRGPKVAEEFGARVRFPKVLTPTRVLPEALPLDSLRKRARFQAPAKERNRVRPRLGSPCGRTLRSGFSGRPRIP